MSLFLHYLSLPYLLEGIELTLQVTALGLIGGLFLGLILAWMQLSRFFLKSDRQLRARCLDENVQIARVTDQRHPGGIFSARRASGLETRRTAKPLPTSEGRLSRARR